MSDDEFYIDYNAYPGASTVPTDREIFEGTLEERGNKYKTGKLVEQFPDEEYVLKKNHPNDVKFLMTLHYYLKEKAKKPVYYQEIAALCEERNICNKFTASQRLRRLWRGGKIRRFVSGEYIGLNQTGGNWHGVAYILGDF